MASDKQKKNTPKTAWKPGQSGNPKGRPPKGETLTDALRERVSKQEIADKLYGMAMEGDIQALKYIYDRIDGKPTESHEISGKEGGPVQVAVQGPEKMSLDEWNERNS